MRGPTSRWRDVLPRPQHGLEIAAHVATPDAIAMKTQHALCRQSLLHKMHACMSQRPGITAACRVDDLAARLTRCDRRVRHSRCDFFDDHRRAAAKRAVRDVDNGSVGERQGLRQEARTRERQDEQEGCEQSGHVSADQGLVDDRHESPIGRVTVVEIAAALQWNPGRSPGERCLLTGAGQILPA